MNELLEEALQIANRKQLSMIKKLLSRRDRFEVTANAKRSAWELAEQRVSGMNESIVEYLTRVKKKQIRKEATTLAMLQAKSKERHKKTFKPDMMKIRLAAEKIQTSPPQKEEEKEPIPIERPAAIYTNISSPFGIADRLHKGGKA